VSIYLKVLASAPDTSKESIDKDLGYVDSVSGYWHHVCVGCVADVSVVLTTPSSRHTGYFLLYQHKTVILHFVLYGCAGIYLGCMRTKYSGGRGGWRMLYEDIHNLFPSRDIISAIK
jgi:hypothetical protein